MSDQSEVQRFEQQQLDGWRRELMEAADLIERDGWVQGVTRRGTRHCMVAAVADVSHSGPMFVEALVQLERHLRTDIEEWNDEPNRRAAEVIAKLREVACS